VHHAAAADAAALYYQAGAAAVMQHSCACPLTGVVCDVVAHAVCYNVDAVAAAALSLKLLHLNVADDIHLCMVSA
jgi:hypothetical protein